MDLNASIQAFNEGFDQEAAAVLMARIALYKVGQPDYINLLCRLKMKNSLISFPGLIKCSLEL